MCTNFEFLKFKKEFTSFSEACIEAEKSILVSPATTAILSRRALELAVKWVYSFDEDLDIPYRDNISTLIHNGSFLELIDSEMLPLLKFIISLGNVAVHTNKSITREEAILSLHNLYQFINWIDYCYGDDYKEKKFEENSLLQGEDKRVRPEELKDLYDKLSSKDKKLEEIIKENEELRREITQKRRENTENYNFNIDEISEFDTRKIYIDVELKLAGWDFNKDIGEEIELFGMPNSAEKGYADYVLYGDSGKPLAVIEAKKTSKDPKIGREQAKLYADCLEKQYNVRPIIFYTNGFETYIWDDYNGYSERRIYGFFKKDELQLMIDRRTQRKSLKNINIKDEISNRYYQKEAITICCEELERRKRKLLLVMATGTGKTRTAISLVDVLTRHNWVKNILFLADRTALVKQAKKNFSKLLPDLSLCNLLDSKDNPEEARMIFSTYPTMMNAIDDTKAKDGKKLFTCGHFDLIIVDESHRSIYKKYKAIFDYFDAYLIGLTATPKDEVDKNTYGVFDMENGVPTYAYELDKAVEDGFLVEYETIEVKSKIMEDGIKYDELSDEDKEEYEDKFHDDDNIGEEIQSSAINQWLFNASTIDLVLNKLMEKGLRIEGNEKLGKTIIFAKNHKHAEAIKERFDILYPKLGSNYAKVIDNQINYVDSLIDDFSDKDKLPQIAISVDMLDTGIDIPEILNLVFFKKVRSKTKFWQMIGRGTRLCENLLGIGDNKDKFLIFDFCNNFEFFRMNPKGFKGNLGQTLSERIFNLKLDLVKELQDLRYSDEEYISYRNELLKDLIEDVNNLNEDNFMVKMNLKYVQRYKNKNEWQSLGTVDVKDIKEHIAPLISKLNDDEFAKRFDILMYTIELANLQGNNVTRPIKSVIETAESLSKLGTIPQIQQQKYIIDKVRTTEFWQDVDLFELDEVRSALRELIKYLEVTKQEIYYTDFEDMIINEESHGAMYNVNDLKNYRKKVEYYLKENENELAIYKLKNNKQLTKKDLETLENIMWNELGTKSDYEKEFGDMPVNKLVRKMVGLDRNTANELFSEFLNNENLNSKQIHFVKLIIDYVVKNGFIDDNKILTEDPFRAVGNLSVLFKDNMKEAKSIMEKISQIKTNAEKIV
ncbi:MULTISPECIES: DEAD/DEAH box helicase family protein [Clostridium]|uniref:DEAD/DEAH box helicase family protein n=1 Tax=Clostridium faecium TaxID=2762223 RepID=A0ABR8YR35_9CLOT|nr:MULTISPECIES: DEAD/DEAH box helicase family protein [Clostridium]MBD8046711.1 DEAD/DEAH box helicase family protein [Clostridium faecium]MDU1348226.1 DEAD/DEAH box helicase family protein [Clostridium argentinense]